MFLVPRLSYFCVVVQNPDIGDWAAAGHGSGELWEDLPDHQEGVRDLRGEEEPGFQAHNRQVPGEDAQVSFDIQSCRPAVLLIFYHKHNHGEPRISAFVGKEKKYYILTIDHSEVIKKQKFT